MSTRRSKKRGGCCAEDTEEEAIDELQAAIDTCSCVAEAELRRHHDGGEKLQLLPDLVEALKVMDELVRTHASAHARHKERMSG